MEEFTLQCLNNPFLYHAFLDTAYRDGGENGTFQLFESNSTTNSLTGSWSTGFSITVEAKSGMLEVILSAPEEFSTGISAGLLGTCDVFTFIIHTGTAGDD